MPSTESLTGPSVSLCLSYHVPITILKRSMQSLHSSFLPLPRVGPQVDLSAFGLISSQMFLF